MLPDGTSYVSHRWVLTAFRAHLGLVVPHAGGCCLLAAAVARHERLVVGAIDPHLHNHNHNNLSQQRGRAHSTPRGAQSLQVSTERKGVI